MSITSLDGFPVARLTTIITNVAKINAGNSSYTANIPPSLAIPNFHMNIIAPPAIIPDTIPYLLALFQKSEQRTTGPNAAPKPAHANETILNTELVGSSAKNIDITDITTTVSLATSIDVFLDILICNTSTARFCDIADEAARSCESAVDMVAARIPARIIPAINAATGLNVER